MISRIQTALNSAQLNVHFFEFLNADWDEYQVLTNRVVTYNGTVKSRISLQKKGKPSTGRPR